MTPSIGAKKSRYDIPPATEKRTRARIARAVFRARLVIFWEDLWPRLVALSALASIFLSLSWFGVWRITPDWARIGALGLFAIAALYLALRAVRARIPDRASALARVEKASGGAHRPATAYSDRLVSASDDPAAQTLWSAHRRRLLVTLAQLRVGLPTPGLTARDPYAFRFLVALVLIVAFVQAGPERADRVGEALRGSEPIAVTLARIDAWVTPPAYTNRPPLFLTGESAQPTGKTFLVPEGSIVTVRTGGNRDLTVVGIGAAGELPAEIVEDTEAKAIGETDAPREHRVSLSTAISVSVRRGEREMVSWNFEVKPDAPPTIALAEPPAPTIGGSLGLSYTIGDDYGVISAEGVFAPFDETSSDAGMRPLFPAPGFPLSLPQLRARAGEGATTRDLTSHPWAGARVFLTLIARDDVGQEGKSIPTELVLPTRRFANPLARAVIEQRANLALDANAAGRVADGLDALSFAGEETIEDFGNYLALRSAYYRLIAARDDDALREIVDYLWSIARGIEDGNLSATAQALRDAQEALRQALENDAPDDEIARLTEELREAMHNFLQAQAEEARRNPQFSNLPPDAQLQLFRSQDFDRMLDRIEELARSGARDAANQLLSELQGILDNLQTGQQMMANSQAAEMMQSLDQLGEMIRRQQELMDQTYRAERGLDPQGEQSREMTREELESALRRLQEEQAELQQSLDELMVELDELGMEPNGKLGQAGEAMDDAAQALGKGRADRAVGRQSEALDALRQGAQSLSEQLASQQQGQGSGGIYGSANAPGQDPLGRFQRQTGPNLGSQVKVPDEIDTQRAREILDSIRRRLGEPTMPRIEREYLERLLDRF